MEIDYLKMALRASIQARNEIMQVYGQYCIDIEYKTDKSPLTNADKAAHGAIMAELSKSPFPIMSEEGIHTPYEIRKNWETYWLVDPLDGTKEFINRNGEFTVNIALIYNGNPIMGVILVPVTNEVYFTLNNNSFKSKATDDADSIIENGIQLPINIKRDDYVVVASKSHMNHETESYINSIDTKGKELKSISIGSSLKICLVAEGNADCYPRFGPTMEWDTAAAHAVATHASKKVFNPGNGQELTYNKKDLLNPYFIVK